MKSKHNNFVVFLDVDGVLTRELLVSAHQTVIPASMTHVLLY